MEDFGTTQTEPASATGSDQSNLSKPLGGKREFNTAHVKALGDYFHVNPAVFIA